MKRPLLLAATLLASSALLPGVSRAQPVTGIYIGAAGGANFLQKQQIESVRILGTVVPLDLRSSFDTGVVGLGSVGYGFGNGLRVELEGNYRYNRFQSSRTPFTVSGRGHEQKYGPMVNVLFDLDIGSPYVFPYIGGGAGYAWVTQKARSATPFGPDDTLGGTDTSFAYQAMAGLSLPIPPVVGLSLTAEYRFYALAGERDFTFTTGVLGAPFSATVRTSDNYNHSLMLGLRYAFNTVPPQVPVSVIPPAPPPPEAPRTYLVFFDWDRADLTDRARQIINEAAQATTRVAVTRIEVAGHTDKSGTPRYNQGLSQRRAANVAAELVRLGVPRNAISTQAFGESRPLVATADGVREPQNRRVEIVLR